MDTTSQEEEFVSDHESSDEASDVEIEPDNEEFEYDFLRALGALHSQDSKALEKKYFKDNYNTTSNKSSKPDKPLTLKDYERHIILNKEGKLDDDDEDNGDNYKGKDDLSKIKKKIVKMDSSSDEEDDDEDGLLTSGLFKKKETSTREHDRLKGSLSGAGMSSEALDYIKGNKSSLSNDDDAPLLDALKEVWNNPAASKKDKWLYDFFLNRRFLEEENDSIERAYNHVIIDEETFSEDEATIKKMQDFETKYNFRYEEPDKEFIKSYPRTMPDTVRPKSQKRKEMREKQQKNKKDKKLLKQKELEEMKATREEMIKERLKKIKAVSGNNELNIDDEILDEEFDPDDYDTKMSNCFGEDYYGGDEGEEYPEMTEEEMKFIGDGDDYMDEGDEEHNTDAKPSTSKKKDLYKLDFEDLVGDTTFRFRYKSVIPNNFGLSAEQILSADDKELNRWCSIKKIMKCNRTSQEENKDYKHYNNRAQLPSVQEKFQSIFKGPEMHKQEAEDERKRKKNLKKKLKRQEKARLKALEEENLNETDGFETTNTENNEQPSTSNKEQDKKKKKKKQKNKRKLENDSSNDNIEFTKESVNTITGENDNTDDVTENNKKDRKHKKSCDTINTEDIKPKKKKKKTMIVNDDDTNASLTGISDLRLEAYGQNPKKLKNKLKYKN